MVFNSIPQFPWSSSRTPHPTERNDFCIFTPNCPIWKKNICKDCKVNPLTNPPISPTQANQPPALWIVTKHTEKNAFHKTRHYNTIHAGGRQRLILEPQAFVLKNRWLPRAANGQSSRAAKQNRHKPLFWLLWDVWRPNHFWKMLGWCMMTQPINVHLRKKSGKFFTT